MIEPSIGRVVWYQPSKEETQPERTQPFAALITYVWGDRLVNLATFDQDGEHKAQTAVQLVQDDDVPHATVHYATWMPYQVGQAKKNETAA